MVQLGFGLYAHHLTDDGFRFARQCGASTVVIHLVDYFAQKRDATADNQPIGDGDGWGIAGANAHLWTEAYLQSVVELAASHELTIAAIENFDPLHWYDVLLAGPRRDEQLAHLAEIIRIVGRVGIPVIGYNFSIAGVASRVSGPWARGGAESVGMDGVDDRPIPHGMVWNMVYDPNLYAESVRSGEFLPEITFEELWQRLGYALAALLPVAESASVRIALHPDDPPAPTVRRQPRLVWRPELYDQLLDRHPSPANALELCLGTLAEMPGHDTVDSLRHYMERRAVGYIHLRNVTGTAPSYRETFLDDGSIDVPRVMKTLVDAGFDGTVVPDHTPLMTCDAPWHAGMAYAMGYLRGALDTVRR